MDLKIDPPFSLQCTSRNYLLGGKTKEGGNPFLQQKKNDSLNSATDLNI